MEDLFPVLIFLILIVASLLNALKKSQEAKEEGKKLPPVVPEKPLDPTEQLKRLMGVFEEDEVKPPESPVEVFEGDEVEGKYAEETAFPEESYAVDETVMPPEEFIPGEESPVTDSHPVQELPEIKETVEPETVEKITYEPALSQKAKLTALPGRIVYTEQILPLSFRQNDVVRGIIYHEVLGAPVGLRKMGENRW